MPFGCRATGRSRPHRRCRARRPGRRRHRGRARFAARPRAASRCRPRAVARRRRRGSDRRVGRAGRRWRWSSWAGSSLAMGQQKPPVMAGGAAAGWRARHADRTPSYTTCPARQTGDTDSDRRGSEGSCVIVAGLWHDRLSPGKTPSCIPAHAGRVRRTSGHEPDVVGRPSSAANARRSAPSAVSAGRVAFDRPRMGRISSVAARARGDGPQPGHEPVERERAQRLLRPGRDQPRQLRRRSPVIGRRTRAAGSRSRTGSAAGLACLGPVAGRRAGRTVRGRIRPGPTRSSGRRRSKTSPSRVSPHHAWASITLAGPNAPR